MLSIVKGQDYNYPLPTAEEIFAKLNGGTVFSKIDLRDAYLQILVEKETWGGGQVNIAVYSLLVCCDLFQQDVRTLCL